MRTLWAKSEIRNPKSETAGIFKTRPAARFRTFPFRVLDLFRIFACCRLKPALPGWGFGALVATLCASAAPLRPPSVPLVACDPYFSIWSPADKLADADTVHWTGKPHRLMSSVRIDGQEFRLVGKEPSTTPALPQIGLEV